MNYRLIFKLIGNVLRIEALLMVIPLAVSFIYGGGDHKAFLLTMFLAVAVGTLLTMLKPKDKTFREKEALTATALTWVAMSVFGALPFFFSGYFDSIADCIFESVSGFTTTGSTILANIEIVPKGILFWRSFTHWIGGMGVLVFVLAVIPSMNASSVNLLRAESTGPTPDKKIVPKIRESARIMYLIYLGMTFILIALLKIAGLPLYDSFVNAFATAGTGGFSVMNASFGAYNNVAAEIITTIFMFLFGVSFSLYFLLLGRKFKKFFKDEELRMFFFIVAAAMILIAFNISGLYGGFAAALRHSSFQVSSVISTTGFATTNFDLWPTFSKVILVLLMVTGCCAGSTGGGIKLIRILLLIKAARIGFGKILHPGSVKSVLNNGKKISNDIISKAALLFFIYFAVLFLALLLISIEGKDLVTSTSAVITALSNVGPGLGLVGPAGNFESFTSFSKIILSFCMIAGRLEFLPVLILFNPTVWKKRRVKHAQK